MLPNFEYLKFGNIYSGSFKDFNFKIFPDIENSEVCVVIWKGKFCFEKSEMLFKKKFCLEKDSLEKIRCWLSEKYFEAL